MLYNFRAIIFDFDDTLIDSKGGIVYHQKVAASMGWRVPPQEELEKYWGLGWEEFIGKCWPEISFVDFRQAYIDYNQKEPRCYTHFPGTRETIKKLKKENFILGILSNRNTRSILDILRQMNFPLDDFEIICGEEEVFFHKPDPRAFDEILVELGKKGIRPEEMIYVGDTGFDLAASRGRGIKFVGVLTGLAERAEFTALGVPAPDVIKSVKDLPAWLAKYGRA
ncbi:MAG: HAD-IA family hydrolase [bacterium]|nr:HAD-IA family hydrolase [bacterium]